MVSAVYQVTCGVTTTFSRSSSGLSAAPVRRRRRPGRPRPADRREGSSSAASSTMAPREVLTSTASGFITSSAARSISFESRGHGRCRVTMSLVGQQVRQRPPPGAVVGGAGVQTPWRPSRATMPRRVGDVAVADQSDGAPADVAHGLAECRVGRPAAALRVARSSVGSRRSAASISSTVPSATDGALAPGMLATAMPSSVAVSTSIVLTPAPSLWTSRTSVRAAGPRRTVDAARARSPRPRAAHGEASRRRPRAHHRTSSQSDSGATKSSTLSPGGSAQELSAPPLGDPFRDGVGLLAARPGVVK